MPAEKIIDMQEFAPRLARAPYRDGRWRASFASWKRRIRPANTCHDGVVIVPSHKDWSASARSRRNRAACVGLPKLDARDLRDGIPFIREFERAREERFLADRDFGRFWIDAG